MHFDEYLDIPAIWLDHPGSCLSQVYFTTPKGSFSGPLEETQQTGVFPILSPIPSSLSPSWSQKADGASPEQGWHHKTLEPGSVFAKNAQESEPIFLRQLPAEESSGLGEESALSGNPEKHP